MTDKSESSIDINFENSADFSQTTEMETKLRDILNNSFLSFLEFNLDLFLIFYYQINIILILLNPILRFNISLLNLIFLIFQFLLFHLIIHFFHFK